MTSRDFCYWLQGFFEIRGFDNKKPLTSAQVEMVQKHLNLVFYHEIDNSFGKDKDALISIHSENSDSGKAKTSQAIFSGHNEVKYFPGGPPLFAADDLKGANFYISC